MPNQSINPNDGKTIKTLEHFGQSQLEKHLATADDFAKLAIMEMRSFVDF